MPRISRRRPEAQDALRAFGDRLREIRLSAMLTQAELAERSQMQPLYVWRMEAGVANPSLVTLVLVSRALGCELADLLSSR
jgi:transcriptional regulator with XRE-family HTH domain